MCCVVQGDRREVRSVGPDDSLEDLLTAMSQLCWADPTLAESYWVNMRVDDIDHTPEAEPTQRFLLVIAASCPVIPFSRHLLFLVDGCVWCSHGRQDTSKWANEGRLDKRVFWDWLASLAQPSIIPGDTKT